MTLQIVQSESKELAANPAIRGIIAEVEKYFINDINRFDKRNLPLRFRFSIQNGTAQTFGIHNLVQDCSHPYHLGANHRLFFDNVTLQLERWEGAPFHELTLVRGVGQKWQATIAVNFKVLQNEEHSRYIDRAMVKRRQWLAEFLGVPAIQVYDLRYPSMPFPIDPIWPSNRFGFMIGYTRQYVWLMSNGLSNPPASNDGEAWISLKNCHNVEILSRLPKDGLGDDGDDLALLLRNRYLSTFLAIAGTISLTDGSEFSTGPNHRYFDIEYDKYTTNPPTGADVGCFVSDLQSLRLAEPIDQPDRPFPRVAVRFATLLRRTEPGGAQPIDESDNAGIRISRDLIKSDRIGFLDPECMQERSTISF